MSEEIKKVNRTTIYIEDGLFKRIKIECINRGYKLSELIRELLEKWLNGQG